MQRRSILIALSVCFTIATASTADTFAYDARGRMIGACQTTAANARRVEYALDAAGNRSVYRNHAVIVAIPANSSIWSSDGRFQLTMQGDGNFVIYGPSGALWASNTTGSGSNDTAIMQGDGNLVIYTQSGTPIWASGTGGQWCATMSMQTDGNLVIYDLTGKPIWSTNTGGH